MKVIMKNHILKTLFLISFFTFLSVHAAEGTSLERGLTIYRDQLINEICGYQKLCQSLKIPFTKGDVRQTSSEYKEALNDHVDKKRIIPKKASQLYIGFKNLLNFELEFRNSE